MNTKLQLFYAFLVRHHVIKSSLFFPRDLCSYGMRYVFVRLNTFMIRSSSGFLGSWIRHKLLSEDFLSNYDLQLISCEHPLRPQIKWHSSSAIITHYAEHSKFYIRNVPTPISSRFYKCSLSLSTIRSDENISNPLTWSLRAFRDWKFK